MIYYDSDQDIFKSKAVSSVFTLSILCVQVLWIQRASAGSGLRFSLFSLGIFLHGVEWLYLTTNWSHWDLQVCMLCVKLSLSKSLKEKHLQISLSYAEVPKNSIMHPVRIGATTELQDIPPSQSTNFAAHAKKVKEALPAYLNNIECPEIKEE